MAQSDCGWTCGCAGKTVRSLENTCHTWALLRWRFTTKRRYIKCMHLYLTFFYLSLTHSLTRQGVTCIHVANFKSSSPVDQLKLPKRLETPRGYGIMRTESFLYVVRRRRVRHSGERRPQLIEMRLCREPLDQSWMTLAAPSWTDPPNKLLYE